MKPPETSPNLRLPENHQHLSINGNGSAARRTRTAETTRILVAF